MCMTLCMVFHSGRSKFASVQACAHCRWCPAHQHQSSSNTRAPVLFTMCDFGCPVLLLSTLTIWHRPAAAAEVVTGGATTAIPAHVDVVGDDHTRYLVSVKPALVPTNSSRLLGSRGSRRSSLVQSARQPFDDVKLGPLLGKGGFGRVYRAVWNGAAVACKVQTNFLP